MSNRYEILLWRIRVEIPGIKVIKHEDSILMRVIHAILKVLTLGKFQPSRFTTTIGKRMYVPNDWYELSDQRRYTTLRHEIVHMRQFRRWPFKSLDKPGLRLINFFLFSLCYLFVLPTKWTMRAKFEREAYIQTMLVHYEIIGRYTLNVATQLENGLAELFGGSSYFYMWDEESARNWAKRIMTLITIGAIRNDKDRVDLG